MRLHYLFGRLRGRDKVFQNCLKIFVRLPIRKTKVAYGHAKVAIPHNTDLKGLASGAHTLTVYAQDAVCLIGTSSTIDFAISRYRSRIPTTLVIFLHLSPFPIWSRP